MTKKEQKRFDEIESRNRMLEAMFDRTIVVKAGLNEPPIVLQKPMYVGDITISAYTLNDAGTIISYFQTTPKTTEE